ncbi:MAG: CDP-alcohol phosphatidyltransferase family protein, partial [Verrucomicrobiota bacterium]
MTFATQLTVFRILLIPVFVLFCIYYGEGVSAGAPEEWQRLAAIAVFILASI